MRRLYAAATTVVPRAIVAAALIQAATSLQAMEVYSYFTLLGEGYNPGSCVVTGSTSSQSSNPCLYQNIEGDPYYTVGTTPGFTTQTAPYADSGSIILYDASGNAVSQTSAQASILPGDGSLLKLGSSQSGYGSSGERTFQAIDVRMYETIWVSVPQNLDGQEISMSLSVPFDGSFNCDTLSAATACGNLFLQMSLDTVALSQLGLGGTMMSFVDQEFFSFTQTSGAILDDTMTVTSVIRSASGNYDLIPVLFTFTAFFGGVYSGNSWDIDLLNTLYFDISLPDGVSWYTTSQLLESVRSGPDGGGGTVPAPATLGLLAVGALGLGAFRPRRPV